MKKLLLILVISSFCQAQIIVKRGPLAAAGGGGSTATLIQSCSNNTSSGGAASIDVTCSATSAHHLLIAFGLNIQSAAAAPVITDDHTQTWSTAFSNIACQTTQFGTAGCAFAYVCDSAAGMTTVHISGAGFAAITGAVREYSGVQTTSCLDQVSALLGQNSTSPGSSSSITTTATDLIIGVATGGHTETFGLGSGYTDLLSVPDTNASQLDVALENILTTASGSKTATFTNSGGNGQGIGIVSFKLL
jgi:hypothetical protein